MNILFCSYNEEWHGAVMQTIINEVNGQNVVSISKINHMLESSQGKYQWIDNVNYTEHIYEYFKDKELPPLDAELLGKMCSYESLFYPMLDRYEINKLVIVSYQQRAQYYKKCLSTLLWVLKYYNIDMCFFSDIPHIGFDYILYGLCKTMNIATVIAYHGVPIPHKTTTVFFLNDIFNPIPELGNLSYKKEESGDKEKLSLRMQSYIDQYNRNKENITSFVFLSTFDKTNKVKKTMDLLVQRIKEKELLLAIKRKWHRFWDGQKVDKYLEKIAVTSIGEKYIYYPLHYQPECTSLPMGGKYHDQLLVIKMLSRNLPDDVMLYVKPHPKRCLYADKKYYEEISALRNVSVVAKNVNTYELIDNALAIVSLTGTVILEALVRKKNVLMFGYYIWQYAPGVYHCKTEKECKSALDEICNGHGQEVDKLVDFLSKLDDHLIDGVISKNTLPLYELQMEENIDNVSKGYVDFVKKMLCDNNKLEN